jgi:aminoglycoside 2'-N-acetyltransferase I
VRTTTTPANRCRGSITLRIEPRDPLARLSGGENLDKAGRATIRAVTDLRLAHTSDLDAATLAEARALLEDVFAEDFSREDWDHTVGGIHALLRDDGLLVGHAAVVGRELRHGGRVLRTGYVEGVAVRRDRHGRGHGALLMDAVEAAIHAHHEVGALSSSEEALGFYAARGWHLWKGPTSVLTPDGVVRTPDDDGGVYVLPVSAPLDLAGELTCDWRPGEVW